LRRREEGQDLVEYALILALIALGATVAMKALASGISTEFNTITGNL
jgi:pilus assembly protein Flp/PilA